MHNQSPRQSVYEIEEEEGASDSVTPEEEAAWKRALQRLAQSQRVAVTASWLVNWFLLAAKIVAFVVSHSKAVLASLADSAGVCCKLHPRGPHACAVHSTPTRLGAANTRYDTPCARTHAHCPARLVQWTWRHKECLLLQTAT
jgi:hypothetical protein